jgi:rhodanese-related sulfurtransferase
VSHAGDLTPEQTYRLLQDDPRAVLVDVRTTAEWAYVGLPDLSSVGRTVACVEWTSFPDGAPNPAFLDQLAQTGVEPGVPVAFICRSGVRSAAAADLATASGLGPAYNVADGFEGPLDGGAHRGGTAGWKASGLPWRQG